MATQMESIGQTAKDGAQKAKEVVSGSAYMSGRGVRAGETGEGRMTKQIESVTSRVPSSTFLTLALGSIAVSAILQGIGRKNDAHFIGQWVPTILIMGLYNKLVKLEGSE